MHPNHTITRTQFNARDLARFFSHVVAHDYGQCWEWTGRKNHRGYGVIMLGGKRMLAHRIMYAIEYGSTPGDLLVCHHCDNPGCLRPGCFFLGTERDNNRDRHSKGRTKGFIRPDNRGEGNQNAVITSDIVRSIRCRYAAGETGVSLAREFNISSSLVSQVVNRRTWKHIE